MKIARTLVIAATIASTATPALAQQQRGWSTIGYQTVDRGADRDTIRVRGNERHRQVRICAIGQPFRLVDAQARFANGGQQDIAQPQRIRAGNCSAPLDLRGQRRNLQSVSLTYEKMGRRILPPLVRIQAR